MGPPGGASAACACGRGGATGGKEGVGKVDALVPGERGQQTREAKTRKLVKTRGRGGAW